MKSIKQYFIPLLIATLLLPITSTATTLPNSLENTITNPTLNNESIDVVTKIISLSSKTVKTNTDFYLILNLSEISYTNFKVEISNTANLTASTVTSNVSDLEATANITSFIVDKNLINLDKLGIVYTSPAQETNILFKVKITNLENKTEEIENEILSLQSFLQTEFNNLKHNLTNFESTLVESELTSEEYQAISNSISKVSSSLENAFNSSENTLENDITDFESTLTSTEILEENYQSILDTLKSINTKILERDVLLEKINNPILETMEETSTIAIRNDVVTDESTNKNNKENLDKPFGEKDGLLEDLDKNDKMSSNMKDMMAQMSKLQLNLAEANNTISSLTKTISYQGSQNNYLKYLNISNVEFKNNFKKTTLDYFATVDKDISSVTVNATPEDNSAIVTIYGNTDLQSGKNKVLITVTADDGSIKTYKIYITK